MLLNIVLLAAVPGTATATGGGGGPLSLAGVAAHVLLAGWLEPSGLLGRGNCVV